MIQRLRNKVRRSIGDAVFSKSVEQFVPTFNRWGKALGYSVQVSQAGNLIRVSDKDSSIIVGRPERVRLFAHGLNSRRSQLLTQYFIDLINIRPRDIVIDVGANIGEVSKAMIERGARTISIEPEEVEFLALKENLAQAGDEATLFKGALWSEEKQLKFFSKNESGDSSLIEMQASEAVITVQATTLDNLYAKHGEGQRIRLIKLEAEGAEPEILDGASKMLPQVDYITADVGPERGIAAENTLVPVLKRLLAAGFEPIAFGHVRGVMLFGNTSHI